MTHLLTDRKSIHQGLSDSTSKTMIDFSLWEASLSFDSPVLRAHFSRLSFGSFLTLKIEFKRKKYGEFR